MRALVTCCCLLALTLPHGGAAALTGDVAPLEAPNGCIDLQDAVTAMKIRLHITWPVTPDQLAAADVAGPAGLVPDGSVDILDVLHLLKAAVLAQPIFPAPPCDAACAPGAGVPWAQDEAGPPCDGVDNDCDGVIDEDCCVPGALSCPCAVGQTCEPGAVCNTSGSGPTCEACSPGSCPCQVDSQCLAGFACGAGGLCEPCLPGSLGCSCDTAGACAGCDHCVEGRCVADSALPGLLGCDCGAEDACAGALACTAGTCQVCPAGGLGCACLAGTACTDGGTICAGGACVPCNGDPCVPCTPGTLGCTCGPDLSCAGPFGGGLCVGGLCVPLACPKGSNGCPCYGNDSCDPYGGVALTCNTDKQCIYPQLKSPGDLGTVCQFNAQCGNYFGMPLGCVGGLCAVPGCPFGGTGCPCTDDGGCAEAPAVHCKAGVCVAPACAEGTSGCACDTGACLLGMECVAGICAHAGQIKLKINATKSRGCDVLLQDTNAARIVNAQYAGVAADGCGAQGIMRRRGNRVALSFICSKDAAMTGTQLTLSLSTPTATLQGIQVLSTACYNQLGAPVSTAGVSWE